MRNIIITLLLVFSFLSIPGSGFAMLDQKIVEQLTTEINLSKDNLQKSTLYVYRGRNFFQAGRLEEALRDFNEAIALDQSRGFIFLERSKVFLAMYELSKAGNDALAAKEKSPALTFKADQLLKIVEEKLSQVEKILPILNIAYLDEAQSNDKSILDAVNQLKQCNPGHQLDIVSDQGSVIILKDNSTWLVAAQQRAEAAFWHSGDPVTVCSKLNFLVNMSNPDSLRRINVRKLK